MATLSEISVGDTVSWSIPKDPDPPSVVHGVITSINREEETANMRVWSINEDGSHDQTDRTVTMPVSRLRPINDFREEKQVSARIERILRDKVEFCVYNEEGTRRFGCYPTQKLAEARLQQIHMFGESQYEEDNVDDWDTEFEEAKAEVSKDTFTTMEEARDRAEELGCSGTHTHDDEGRLVYMPCATHEEYERRLAEENGDT